MPSRTFSKIIVLAVLCLGLGTACEFGTPRPPTAQQIQAQKASKAAKAINFTENAEIDNIQRRLRLTSDPGAIGFVLLLNEAGQPIYYAAVKGKITSGGKRLTQTWQAVRFGIESYGPVPTPSDEGTYGSSNPYVYFWTQSGQYMQWNGTYMYSDKPFRLTVEPLVIDIATE